MDTKTAIRRIFHIFAGINPDLLGTDWDRNIAIEVACILANELTAVQDIKALLPACVAGYGVEATGVTNWTYGLVVLLRTLSSSRHPTVRAFLYEMTSFGNGTEDWLIVRAEAQRLLREGAKASWTSPPPPSKPIAHAPAYTPSPQSSGTANAAQPAQRRPLRGLVLPVILLFVIWALALLGGSNAGVYPNSLLCIYSTGYCMLLGSALPLLQRKRYAFAAIVLLLGALFSALTLGWTKVTSINTTNPGFLQLMGHKQYWLDLLVLTIPAALIIVCGLLLRRLHKQNAEITTAFVSGFVVLLHSMIAMLVLLPVVTFLSVLFSIFAGFMLGTLTASTTMLIEKSETRPLRRIRLGGGAILWFSFCIILTLILMVWIGTADEEYAPMFMFCLGFVQIAMLIVLLCKRSSGYFWYTISSLAIFMCGLTNFLFAYVISGSWLPLVLFSGLFNMIGPVVGWFIIRKQFQLASGDTLFPNSAWSATSVGTLNSVGISAPPPDAGSL